MTELQSSTERLPAADDRRPPIAQPPGVPSGRSTYLDRLPSLYQSDDFLARFLLVFEHVLSPIERTVGNLPHYVDPALVPESLLDWLGSWLGLAVDERWPEERRRDLIGSAASLYRWRGTKRGLSEFIRLYTGVEPVIEDGDDPARPHQFRVTLAVPPDQTVDEELLRAVIQVQKPAWAGFTLNVLTAGGGPSTVTDTQVMETRQFGDTVSETGPEDESTDQDIGSEPQA